MVPCLRPTTTPVSPDEARSRHSLSGLLPTAKLAEQIGDDNIVISTDFPHEDSRYPHATEEFLKLPFRDASKRKIMWDNPARLYGLG